MGRGRCEGRFEVGLRVEVRGSMWECDVGVGD